MEFRIVKTKKERKRLYVNKLAAADRQLGLAIRLFFLAEDSLGIFTLANAAYGIYADLLRKNGKSEWEWPIQYGLLRAAYDLAHGVLTEQELNVLTCGNEVGLSTLLEVSRLFSDRPDLQPEDVSVPGLGANAYQDWLALRRPGNFLKHADRDSGQLLDEAEIEVEEVILRAVAASLHLNAPFTPEKEFFYSAMIALGNIDQPGEISPTTAVLCAHEAHEIMELGRRNLCGHLLISDVIIDRERAASRMERL